MRPLGNSVGSGEGVGPSVFPHDLKAELNKYHNSLGLPPSAPRIFQEAANERALLNMFFAKIAQEDPDLIISHNLLGFELEVIVSRAMTNKVPLWSQIGRLRRNKPPRNILDRDLTAGRILCDSGSYKNHPKNYYVKHLIHLPV